MAVVTEQARAKINLTLHVRGRRADGYHLLESVVAFADFGDELSFERAADFTLDLTGPFADGLPEDDDNIVLDAARNLAHGVSDLPPGAAITLDKRLPVASGIGGGSADAAACIRGLLQLYGVDAAPNALHQIAVGLGADVPVCLRSEVSFMAGIGQLVTPLPRLPDVHCVLVNPRVPVPTAPIFQALGLSEGEEVADAAPPPPRAAFASAAELAAHLAQGRNDLEPPAMRLVREIGDVHEALFETAGCLLARMSGSGATCFGLYATTDEAAAAAKTIAGAHPDWWTAAAPLR